MPCFLRVTPLQSRRVSTSSTCFHGAHILFRSATLRRSRAMSTSPLLTMSLSKRSSVPSPLRLPRVRVSFLPLTRSERLKRVAKSVSAMYAPAVPLLLLRAAMVWNFAPLPLPERLLALALAIIVPEFRRVASTNLAACAQVVRRAERSSQNPERLVRAVRIHTVLTAVTAAGTLSGLVVSLFRPANGALVTLLFQAVFYIARRVRFEPNARVYRCHSKQYRDIVWACCSASVFVSAVLSQFVPLLFSIAALAMSVFYWVLKWIFVPASIEPF